MTAQSATAGGMEAIRRNGAGSREVTALRTGRQPRSDCFAHRIDVSSDPFVSFLSVNPKGYPPAFPYSRGQTRKPSGGVRQMVQNTDGKCQVKSRANRRVQQVADNHVGVRELTSVRKGNECALAQIQRDYRFCTVRRHDCGVAPLPASPLEYDLVREIPGSQRGHPVEKFLFVIVAKIAPARPFFRKS